MADGLEVFQERLDVGVLCSELVSWSLILVIEGTDDAVCLFQEFIDVSWISRWCLCDFCFCSKFFTLLAQQLLN